MTPETQTYSVGNKVIGGKIFTDQVPLAADTYYQGMPLQYEAAGVVTPNVGNTGDGTLTLVLANKKVPAGTYNLECTYKAGTKTAPLGMVADGGNTGNGAPGVVTLGADVKSGVYTLECISATVSGSEIFRVTTPTGELMNNLTVGVAFVSTHFSITLADGLTDFIVGDGFTITVSAVHGGVFKLVAPTGEVLDIDIELPGTALGSINYVGHGFTLTLTDGAIDFEVGDKFAIAVSTAGTYRYTTDYDAVSCVYDGANGRIILAPGYGTVIIFGELREDGVVNDAGVALTFTEWMRQAFAKAGLYIKRM